ncbi:MAG: hypothetical protein M9965_19285 [Anaerolineae bacterium]|nr:hypothetical protein [Anaerolineae bacterium]
MAPSTAFRNRTRDLRQGCGQGDVCAQRDRIGRWAGAFVGIRQGDAAGQLIGACDRPGRRAERFVGKGALHRLARANFDRQGVIGQAETAAGSGTGGAGQAPAAQSRLGDSISTGGHIEGDAGIDPIAVVGHGVIEGKGVI